MRKITRKSVKTCKIAKSVKTCKIAKSAKSVKLRKGKLEKMLNDKKNKIIKI